MNALDNTPLSRRAVLRASGGAAALFGVGVARAGGGDDEESDDCSETTFEPSTVHYDDSIDAVCTDDHPETQRLHEDVAAALEDEFPTVGSLIEDGYIPYFDFLAANEAAQWSHWLNPDYLGDEGVVDPERPESILVDHKWWRPIGVMFVATDEGHRVDPPPAVYEEDGDEGEEAAACTPWHAHVGLPGRYSWWKYRTLYVQDSPESGFPCRTPWMLHMWAYDHPESLYAHHAPPRGSRGGGPAEEAGFETDAVPGEDLLGPEVLPDALRHRLEHL